MQTQEEVVQAVYKYAAELVKGGLSAKQMEGRLIEKGLDPGAASIVVRNVFSWRAMAIHKAAGRNMLYGALWCLGGLLITLLTFSAAGEGGRFLVAWGAVLFGALQFFRGFFQFARSLV